MKEAGIPRNVYDTVNPGENWYEIQQRLESADAAEKSLITTTPPSAVNKTVSEDDVAD